MTDHKKIFLNATVRWFAEGINKVLWFVLIIILARKLGNKEFGLFNYALSFGSIITTFTDLGTNIFLVKKISYKKSLAEIHLNNILSIKVILSVIVLFFILIVNIFIVNESISVILICISLIVSAFLDPFNSVFRAYTKMYYESLIVLLWRILIVGLSLIVLYSFIPKLTNVALALIAGGIFAVVAASINMKRAFGVKVMPFKEVHLELWKTSLRESLPIGFIIILSAFFLKLNIIILQYISGADEVGFYSAGYKLIEAIFFISTFFINAVFPLLCKENQGGRLTQDAINIFLKSLLLLVSISALIALIFTIFRNEIIMILFGNEFLPASQTLAVISWALLFIFSNELLMYLYMSMEKQVALIKNMIACLIVYVITCFILIINYDKQGAAWAFLIAQILLFVTNSTYIFRLHLKSV